MFRLHVNTNVSVVIFWCVTTLRMFGLSSSLATMLMCRGLL